jgi:hypothetical protein
MSTFTARKSCTLERQIIFRHCTNVAPSIRTNDRGKYISWDGENDVGYADRTTSERKWFVLRFYFNLI